MFGAGCYFAEDAEKVDQYARPDAGPSGPGHAELAERCMRGSTGRDERIQVPRRRGRGPTVGEIHHADHVYHVGVCSKICGWKRGVVVLP